jgi:hypothetical protein
MADKKIIVPLRRLVVEGSLIDVIEEIIVPKIGNCNN